MLEDDLMEVVLQAVNMCTIPIGWNDTGIVMIPKVNSVEKVTQFRTINLCNVVYTIIAKMVTNHLKVFLPGIIGLAQSAFVCGRMITDNV